MENKMKHNKKRNTAFLYECLVKELTKCVLKEDKGRQTLVKNILKEYFYNGSVLKSELNIYNMLLDNKTIPQRHYDKLLRESKIDFESLDRKAVFNRQTALIDKINKQLGTSVYSNFIPNYKDLATVGLYFQNKKLNARKRIMLEENLVNMLGRQTESTEDLQHVDNLTYKTFVNRFNETYNNTLRKEQKDLLTNYIVSFSDNGLSLKSYLNEEIGRLKSTVNTVIVESVDPANIENFKKVAAKLDSYTQMPINQRIVREVFYIQDLLAEVNKDVN